MRVYVDGLFYKGSGIGRYYQLLVRGLARKGLRVYTSVPAEFRSEFGKDFRDCLRFIEAVFVDYSRFSPKGFVAQSVILKRLEDEVEVFHYPHINLPLYVPENLVTTVHDIWPLTETWDRGRLKRLIIKFLLLRAFLASELILTVSETVRAELLRHLFLTNRIRVSYNTVAEKFLKKNYFLRSTDSLLLFVGNRRRNKNLHRLIKAFGLLANRVRDLKLVIAGGRNENSPDEVDRLVEDLNLNGRVLQVVSPSDDQVAELYRKAMIFVFPSVYEGFGIPPLEALVSGTAVAVSGIPVLREIYRKVPFYFDPYKEGDIAEKILTLWSSPRMRRRIVCLADVFSSSFSEEAFVKSHLKAYEEVLCF